MPTASSPPASLAARGRRCAAALLPTLVLLALLPGTAASAGARPGSRPGAHHTPRPGDRPGAVSNDAQLASAVSHAVSDATTNTIDPYGPAGMNVDAAQSYLGSGETAATAQHIEVAYVEGGVNWFNSGFASSVADSMWINWHDTPVPCVGSTLSTATMTLDGKTVPCSTAYSTERSDYETVAGTDDVTVDDWAHDPRVTVPSGETLDPEDLIVAFSGSAYVPSHPSPAGYEHAISGWDFYNNQNDPATTDGSYNHSDDQMGVIHTVCPSCLIMPVKAGDEAIDSTEQLAKAWLFAGEAGAKVIVSVTADLGYSSFEASVLAYLDSLGVVVVESSNDFDSADHQGGMYWGNVLPGNGLVPNTNGVSGSTLQKMSGPFWTRSDLTSFGVHNMFSVATNGGSTSESTPTLGAIMALVLSQGEKAAAAGEIKAPLAAAQAVQVLKDASAEPSAPAGSALPWPAAPGNWNEQYGYGMPDVLTALQDVAAGDVPASPEIDSPAWYSVTDPSHGGTVPVTGTVAAYPTQSYTWDLQWGLGGDPSTWHTISSGTKTGSFSGTFGTLELAAIPSAFYDASFSLSTTKELTTFDQYDVTFRVDTSTTVGSSAVTGEARRVVDAFHDSSAMPGFPMAIGSSGESQPALADLQGTGVLDLVFGTADGTIEAVDPRTGKELAGWPVHTGTVSDVDVPAGVTPGYQPIVADIAVGDLDHDGQLSVVATTEDGYVYAFNSRGVLEPGWPRVMDDGVVPPAIPRLDLAHERLPVLGAAAPPVLTSLSGNGILDVVQSGWDGDIHAWDPAGASLAGWPVRVSLPSSDRTKSGYTLEDDQKLDTPPAIAHFSRTGAPDLVIRSQYTQLGPSEGGLQAVDYGYVFAYSAAGKLVPGWPVALQGTIEDYGSAQEFITEGTDSPAVADVLGTKNGNDSADDVAVGPIWSPESLIMPDGTVAGTYGSPDAVLASLLNVATNPSLAIFGPLPPTTPTPFTGSGAFGEFGGHLSFGAPEIGAEHLAAALIYNGSGNPINQMASAWDALGLSSSKGDIGEMAGFPSTEQGQDFLGEPIFAPVGTGSGNDLVIGGDSGAVDARLSTGSEAPGFPKFTGGWSIYGPSAGDLLGNGHDDLVTITREGYLFVWTTPAPAPVTDSWWRAFHDEHNSGNLSTDSRPPGVVRGAKLAGTAITFEAPGAHWYDGLASTYEYVAVGPSGTQGPVVAVKATSGAGSTVHITVPSGTSAVIVRAINSDLLVSNAEKVTSSAETTVAWPG